MGGFRLRCGIFCIVLWSSLAVADSEPFVLLDSLAGKVEVQRAGHEQWRFVQQGATIHNNDVVRVLKAGVARLRFPDGSIVFVRQNSQILVNLVKNGENSAGLSHATVFFGAVFFVIQKTLPRAWTGANQTKIYTPTAVVSLRGTSFEVGVEKQNGTTSVRVVNGTVLVRNILKSVSVFLSAPYQTEVAMNAEPLAPRAVLRGDLDTLRTWVPHKYIDTEIKEQLANSHRDQQVIVDIKGEKLVVMQLVNASLYAGSWPVGRQLTNWIASDLKKAMPKLTVISADTLIDDPRPYAKQQNARYVVMGTIEVLDVVQHAEISARADEYREYSIARVRVKVQLIDAKEGKLLGEESFAGEVSGKNAPENTWREISKLKFDLKDDAFGRSILGSAMRQVLDQAVEKIGQYVNP